MVHHSSNRAGGLTDTIAAFATPPGRSALAVIRISGAGVPAMTAALAGRLPAPRTATCCTFRDADGNTLDRGMLIYFAAPASATGESVLELYGHGGRTAPQLLLERVLQLGARLARPGEFSERAFLNGKLDLAQAEAVADLIDSQTREAALGAVRSMEGELSRRVHALARGLLDARAVLEASLDFPEESEAALLDLQGLQQQVQQLRAQARQGELLSGGLRVVILGPVNVGKSTLLNALAEENLAIVTDQPGTTRDPVRTTLDLQGLPVLLADTAGLRTQPDPIEAEGIRRGHSLAQQADLILLLQEYGTPPITAPAAPCLRLYNKIDLHNVPARATADTIYLSARTGAGLDLLRAAILARVGAPEGALTARLRHVAALDRCAEHLQHARQQQPELAAEELTRATRALDEITGKTTTEQLLGEIFSRFCIGK